MRLPSPPPRLGAFAPSLPTAIPLTRSIPVAAVLVASETIAWHDRGSIAASDFLPSSLAIGLLVAVVLWSGAARRLPAEALGALAALVALAAWAGLSGLWAPVPSLARDEALLVLTGVVSLVVPLFVLRTPGDRLAALGVFVTGLALLAVATAITLHGSSNMNDVFAFRRLSFPISYANASAGLLLSGFWPALLLAGRRSGSPFARIPAFAAATLLLGTSILAQSKGGILGLAASLLVLVVVSAARLRLVLAALLAAAPVAVAFRSLTRAYDTTGATETHDVQHAAVLLLVLLLVGAILGAAYVFADRRIDLSAQRRVLGRGALALIVLAILAGAAVAATSHPGRFLDTQWRTFKHAQPVGTSSTHLIELGSNRYDFWRVALHEFEHHPLVGDGARSFGPAYLVHGRSGETPARAHSLPLELLSEEGVVGFALAAVAYLLLLGGLVRRARRRSAAATAALGGCVLLLAQACVDWTFTFPALTIPFFVLAGIGLADDGRRRLPAPVSTWGSAVVAVLAIVLFAPPWLSAKLVHEGETKASGRDLRLAHDLDPVSVDPWIGEASIARSPAAAIPPLERARARAPKSLQVRFLLGSVYYHDHHYAQAEREFEAAVRLAPREPEVAQALAVTRRALR